jgi:hypothetical protein
MGSSLLKYLAPAALAAALLAFPGCAGSKSSSSGSDYSAMGSQEAAKSAKLDEARRSAEDAEQKAHQMREEKARTQSKTSPN